MFPPLLIAPLNYDRFMLSFRSGFALVFLRYDASKFGCTASSWAACPPWSFWKVFRCWDVSNICEIMLMFWLSRFSTGPIFWCIAASACCRLSSPRPPPEWWADKNSLMFYRSRWFMTRLLEVIVSSCAPWRFTPKASCSKTSKFPWKFDCLFW